MKLTKQQFIEKLMNLTHPSNPRQYNCAVGDIASMLNDTEIIPDSVDAELEEVRKAFPVDHYVRYVQGDFKSIRKIKSIERNAKNIIIVKYSDGGFDYIKDVELIPGSERVVVGSPDTDIMENVS